MATLTAERQGENAEYQTNIKNLVDAEKTIEKAHKVLKKFYDWLHAKQGPHHYDKHDGKDSGSANGKRIPEASVEQLEDACSADPACAGFNSSSDRNRTRCSCRPPSSTPCTSARSHTAGKRYRHRGLRRSLHGRRNRKSNSLRCSPWRTSRCTGRSSPPP